MSHRQLQTLFGTITAIGAKIPSKIEAERDGIDRLAERVASLDVGNALPAALIAALEADRDPLDDPAVLREVARATIGSHGGGLREQVDKRAVDFMTVHTGGIIEALRGPFDAAAAVLAEAHADLGDVDLDDSATIIRKGGSSAQSALDALAAQQQITRVLAVLGILTVARAYPSPSPHRLTLASADPDPALWLEDQRSRTNVSAWQLVLRGFPLSLATSTELRERMDGITAASARVASRYDAERADAQGRQYRHTAPRVIA